ncbi:hypothetical protein ET989_09255 [Propioniciclava sinopodophylli]|uniref:ATPase n=1 Tax=Propioniciclava sinopodophylli TaxID=1837344 RepID=A0A4Q9KDW6_9ACTN|nr:hypothetical protein [Propioniciclava sinopodophylli]TBT84323.1 hypothetical protein ET989_09255 [Propioniciclava sinopodophylli]
MTTPNEALAAIRHIVEQAKGVPMTSNVMVSRAELLGLIARAEAAASVTAADPEMGEAAATLADARTEAERIVAEAREEAVALVGESEVAQAAEAEAEALRLESHTWVDNHLAEFETGLQRAIEQVETLRDRLASRSQGDDTL